MESLRDRTKFFMDKLTANWQRGLDSKLLEEIALPLGFIIGIATFGVYLGCYQNLRLNPPNIKLSSKVKPYSLPKPFPLDLYINSLPIHTPNDKKLIQFEQCKYLFVTLGIVTGVIMSVFRTRLEHMLNFKIEMYKNIEELKAAYISELATTESEITTLNSKYENDCSTDLQTLDKKFFAYHDRILDKLNLIQAGVVKKCLKYSKLMSSDNEFLEMCTSIAAECTSTITDIISIITTKRFLLCKRKHEIRELGKQPMLLDLEESPFIDLDSIGMNSDLKDLNFKDPKKTEEFSPKSIHTRNRSSDSSRHTSRRHSRNSRILKAIELHVDTHSFHTSTPLRDESDLINLYSRDIFEMENDLRLEKEHLKRFGAMLNDTIEQLSLSPKMLVRKVSDKSSSLSSFPPDFEMLGNDYRLPQLSSTNTMSDLLSFSKNSSVPCNDKDTVSDIFDLVIEIVDQLEFQNTLLQNERHKIFILVEKLKLITKPGDNEISQPHMDDLRLTASI